MANQRQNLLIKPIFGFNSPGSSDSYRKIRVCCAVSPNLITHISFAAHKNNTRMCHTGPDPDPDPGLWLKPTLSGPTLSGLENIGWKCENVEIGTRKETAANDTWQTTEAGAGAVAVAETETTTKEPVSHVPSSDFCLYVIKITHTLII